jgi:Holliday junction resolvase RusA-like endonuclease
MIKFFIPLQKIPSKTAQQKGVRVVHGKPMFYTKPELKQVGKMFRHNIRKHKPVEPFTGAVELVVKWCYKYDDNKHPLGSWKITRPDTDNMLKLLKDCLEKEGYFKNDSQVASEINQKFYNDVQGIFITVREMEKGKL